MVQHAKSPYPQRRADGKFLVRGQSAAGRFLQVIFVNRAVAEVELKTLSLEQAMMLEDLDEVMYVIHARDLNSREVHNLRLGRQSS